MTIILQDGVQYPIQEASQVTLRTSGNCNKRQMFYIYIDATFAGKYKDQRKALNVFSSILKVQAGELSQFTVPKERGK